MPQKRETAVVDFDNTLSGYDKWRGDDVMGPIVPYAKDALLEMREWGWRVVVFTTRGDINMVKAWLAHNGIEWCEVNSTSHNPPGTSAKPIGTVYFDDRDAHCVGAVPYNWHGAMARVRKIYQPRLDTEIDDASTWSSLWIRYLIAPGVRRAFARELPLLLDLIELRKRGKEQLANQIESEAYIDSFGM